MILANKSNISKVIRDGFFLYFDFKKTGYLFNHLFSDKLYLCFNERFFQLKVFQRPLF